jgi:RNA polymerase sigma factor (sigma-70 family)
LLGALGNDAELRRLSWERLARAYYQPVYVHLLMRWRRDEQQARDLAQGFFARCLEKNTLAGYDADKGRFRTYLRACLDHYVVDMHRRANAVARGGGAPARLPLDKLVSEPAAATDATNPEAAFDAEWVRQVIRLAVDALRGHCRDKKKLEHMRIFERYHLESDDAPSYAALAEELGVTVNDVTNRLAYTRRKFRRYVLDVLRDITATEQEYRDEAREVLGVDL